MSRSDRILPCSGIELWKAVRPATDDDDDDADDDDDDCRSEHTHCRWSLLDVIVVVCVVVPVRNLSLQRPSARATDGHSELQYSRPVTITAWMDELTAAAGSTAAYSY